ncbi:interleukin-18-like isoform X1 [Mobula birostris]|uniref:interleukin-18-like isoform X1 n=1 Tax=Mobula birostris TaxID=1983395 RepID=UPI003B27C66A
MQEMRPVEFKDGVLWLEEVPGDYTEDCLEFSHKSTVILRDAQQYILIVQNEVAYFKDMNKSQLNEAKRTDSSSGVQFDLIFYEPTECNRDCKFDNGLPTVSFVIQVNSKKYQMSCSKAKTIEFLEMKTSEEDMVDGDQCNLVFYKRRINQYSCFESALAQNHYLCTVSEKGLFKLGLKEFISQTDETIQIYVEV